MTADLPELTSRDDSGAKVDKRRSPDFVEAARQRARSQWTPAACEAQSDLTRAKMAMPIVRQKISVGVRRYLADPIARAAHVARVNAALARPEVRDSISQGTRAGIARRRARQLDALRQAWAGATDKSVRKQFLAEITTPSTGLAK